jgi:hypothetical protein
MLLMDGWCAWYGGNVGIEGRGVESGYSSALMGGEMNSVMMWNGRFEVCIL